MPKDKWFVVKNGDKSTTFNVDDVASVTRWNKILIIDLRIGITGIPKDNYRFEFEFETLDKSMKAYAGVNRFLNGDTYADEEAG